ncbi:MAG: UDP-2,3-diacylglucosamine hydrolase [Candidatus Cloacimonadota bacterium]|nr:MAG: UDP-2,3-diacylglucosamine hydrolase [Candidatus Cloacimonadota bacterium]
MRVIIASDFHLKFAENEDDKRRRQKVEEFLKSLKGSTDVLILNGDIFDLWFSWNQVIIKGYFSVLKILSELKNSGCRIIFIAGNHDFCFNGFLEEEIVNEVRTDTFTDTIDGLKYFVSHGDSFTTNDLRYKIFRKIIRNGFLMKIFKLVHPDLSLKIGKLMSRSSRDRVIPEKLKEKKNAGLLREAERQANSGINVVAFGHTHNPIKKQLGNCVYVNSGDWIINQSYIEIKDKKTELKYYE